MDAVSMICPISFWLPVVKLDVITASWSWAFLNKIVVIVQSKEIPSKSTINVGDRGLNTMKVWGGNSFCQLLLHSLKLHFEFPVIRTQL